MSKKCERKFGYEGYKKWFAWLMMALVFIESIPFFWQGAEALKNKSAKDLTLGAFILLTLINIIWIFYGYYVVKDIPIMISGILYVIGNSVIITAIILYGD